MLLRTHEEKKGEFVNKTSRELYSQRQCNNVRGESNYRALFSSELPLVFKKNFLFALRRNSPFLEEIRDTRRYIVSCRISQKTD